MSFSWKGSPANTYTIRPAQCGEVRCVICSPSSARCSFSTPNTWCHIVKVTSVKSLSVWRSSPFLILYQFSYTPFLDLNDLFIEVKESNFLYLFCPNNPNTLILNGSQATAYDNNVQIILLVPSSCYGWWSMKRSLIRLIQKSETLFWKISHTHIHNVSLPFSSLYWICTSRNSTALESHMAGNKAR